jgi:glycosyltransferase involved in cell wall biosynthesis
MTTGSSPISFDPELVSVIIPCYQQGRYLEECVASLSAQCYTRWEAIIINDGSSDNTDETARELARRDIRIRYLSQNNSGLAAARNLGIRESRGGYVQFLDADDLLEPLKLWIHVDFLRQNPLTAVACGDVKYFDSETPGVFRARLNPDDDPNWIADALSPGKVHLASWIKHNRIPVCSPIIRRALLDDIGCFNTDLIAYEDWEFWLRALLRGHRFTYAPHDNAACLIRVHATSLSAAPRVVDDRLFRARHRFYSLLTTHPASVRAINFHRMLLSGLFAERADRGARHHLLQTLPLRWHERCLAEMMMVIDSLGLPLPRAKLALKSCLRWLNRRLCWCLSRRPATS